jgi:predicted nuclease of predicted toxin-antitoxin system
MRFLVDAHLPPSLCDLLHTIGLPAGNETTDRVINELSVTDQRIVISKDTDF